MLTNEEIRITLNRLLTPQSFVIFSKLFNLNNTNNFKTIIELLHYNKINLTDLTAIPLLDDIAIELFIKNLQTLYNPSLNSNSGSFNSYSYLIGTDISPTPLALFMREFNEYYSKSIYTGFDISGEVFPPAYIDYGIENGSPYTSFADFKIEFDSKVLNPLLTKYSTLDISTIFPKLDNTNFDTNLTLEEKTFIENCYNNIFNNLKVNFTNENLCKYLIWSNDYPSTFANNIRLFNDLLNIKDFGKIVPAQFKAKVHNMSSRISGVYTLEEINALKSEVFATNITQFSVSDSLSLVLFLWAIINTIEQNNSLSISTNFVTEFKQFYIVIKNFKDLYLEIMDLIISNLYVKVE